MMKKNPSAKPKTLVPIVAAGIAVLGLVVIFGALYLFPLSSTSHPNPDVTHITPVDSFSGKVLPRFKNESDLIASFEQSSQHSNGGGMTMREGAVAGDAVGAPTAAPMQGPTISKSEDAGSAGNSGNYSTTNVQVEGVDEADIVKTDGTYIYSFYKTKLIITQAVPATDMKVVHTINLDNVNPEQMFVYNDKLVLFGNKYEYSTPTPDVQTKSLIYPPRYWGQSLAVVYVYDISDKTNPVKEKTLELPGSTLSSRMVGTHVYFAINTYPNYPILYARGGVGIMEDAGHAPANNATTTDESIIPPYREDGVEKPLGKPTDIGYLPPINAQSFLTLGALDVEDGSFSKETIVGTAEQVYASEQNIYLTSTNWNYPQPIPLGGDVRIAMPMMYNPSPTTYIYKFSLQDGQVAFEGRGEVQGSILNQFSMDEHANHFRIATTQQAQYDNQGKITEQQRNAVYVLDSDMDTVGKLEDVAPGEQIYSARFMGDRAYLVTFKQIDPLFVLDLSDPENPSILGKLKIPGYSNYLHPIDETHILGIGKDTEESKQGDFAYYLGMKMAIFDVSDVEHPTQMHSLVIGDRGTDSPALYDHKAFLFDKEKELLVIPVDYHEIAEKHDASKQPIDWPAYGETTFQGAIVYHVSLADGIQERGRITHIPEEVDLKSGYYYDYRYQVQRALFIDDVLYTLSSKTIKANDLSDLSEIKSLDLVNTPKTFMITARVEGSFCANGCGYQQVILDKDKIIQDSSSGGNKPTINHSERPVYSEYDDIVELLDWDAFKALDETQGCPGCADGSVETITIKNGSTTKTVRMEAGMQVESVQAFLNAINGYVGYYGGPYYPLAVDVGGGIGSSGSDGVATAPPSNATADPMPA